MKQLIRLFSIIHGIIAALFGVAALLLIGIGAKLGVMAFAAGLTRDAAQALIEALGLIAAAVVALQIAQTITEEEVIRDEHISGPTRIRRFLSRFILVIVVSLAIEGLIVTFRAVHENIAQLQYAAIVFVAVSALLAGWGVFVRFNYFAEKLEPEAMADAKREDQKLK